MPSTYHRLIERPDPRLLSLVIPVYNEHESLAVLRPRITDALAGLSCPVEIILVNDGSSDHSLDLLMRWAQDDPAVKVISLARNFGHQAAVTAGLDIASGDAVVIMDADLQDPPEILPQMLEQYRRGYEVVYGQRERREGESLHKRFTAWLFYRLMRVFAHTDLPADTGDFRLISRRVLEAIRSMREMHRFMRGMVAWVGFPQTAVKFSRPPRSAGVTKYPLHRMIRFPWTAAVSFSAVPLRISLVIGFLTAMFGVGAGLWAIWAHFAGSTVRGWTSLMAVVCAVGGAILFSIGVLGEYIGRIFEESKRRPLYVISESANLDGGGNGRLNETEWPDAGRQAQTGAQSADDIPATAIPRRDAATSSLGD